jgi:hypothetical protein
MTLKKVYEPPHSEWAARITFEISHIAEAALHGNRRTAFDTKQFSLFRIMQESFDALLALHQFVEAHEKETASGQGNVRVENGRIVLYGDPDVTLNRLFKDFIVKSRTVLYHLFSITKFLDYDLGFFQLKEDVKFEEAARKFLVKLPGRRGETIIALLRNDRQSWSSMLIGIRNIVIHEVDCPALHIVYFIENGSARALFPTVQTTELREFSQRIWDNLFEFVEDVEVLVLGVHLSPNLVVFQRHPSQRAINDPAKYGVVMRPVDVPPDELVIRAQAEK